MAKVRANGNFVFTVHGKPMAVTEGQKFDSSDEVVRQFAWAFEPPVESASAAPGEKRSVHIPKK